MTQSASTPLQGRTIMPSLTVDNLEASTAFFTGLGFEIEDRWEHEGVLLGIMLRAGGVSLGLSQDDWQKGRDRVKGAGVRLYIEIDGDVDAAAGRARSAGLQLAKEPHDTEWGSRAFEVTEPSGYLLTIASPAAR